MKFKVNQEALNDRIAWAREARAAMTDDLARDIKHLHATGASLRRDVFLLEMERRLQIQEGIEPHEGPSARAWAEGMGWSRGDRHPDCEGLSEFNSGFSRSGSLWGVLKMLDCAGGGNPPSTDQFLDRERSGEWYPRSCR